MFKSLLRTLPSLTGNVTLTCKVTDLDIQDTNMTFGYCKEAELKPLQDKLFNRYISVNLLNSAYEYDVCKFYKKYIDVFYKQNYDFTSKDFKTYEVNNENYARNVNYEFGCKRISYNANKHSFEFFAPIYIDNIDDIPDYFDIHLKINDHFTKTLRIYIGVQHKLNFIYVYLSNYIKQLDKISIFYNDELKSFVYHAIDAAHGGFVKIQDNTINDIVIEQTTINLFDKSINKGFENNKLIMKQIIPLSFMFNIDDVFNDYEKKIYNFAHIENIFANYVKNGCVINLSDFDYDYDLDACYLTNEYSLPENHFGIYKYENKITPSYSKWRLQTCDDYVYHTNLNINYSNENSEIYDNLFVYNKKLDITVNDAKTDSTMTYYGYNMIKDDVLNHASLFFNKENWKECINNYAMVDSFLFNLNNIIRNDNIDYFNIFIVPKTIIYGDNNYTEKYEDIIIAKNIYDYTTGKGDVSLNVESFVTGQYNLVNIKNTDTDSNRYKILHDIYFKRVDKFDKKRKKYFRVNNYNKYVNYTDVKDILDNLTYDDSIFIDGYVQIKNINYSNNLSSVYAAIYDKLFFSNEYFPTITPLSEYAYNISAMSQKTKFYIKKSFIDYYELFTLIYKDRTDGNQDEYWNSYKNDLKDITIYEYDLSETDDNIFIPSTIHHSSIYVDNINNPLLKNVSAHRLLNSYANIDNESMFALYNSLYGDTTGWIMSTPYIKYLPDTNNFTIDENYIQISNNDISTTNDIEHNDDWSLYKYKNTDTDYIYKLYNHISAKRITKDEIMSIARYSETYYMYIDDTKDFDLGTVSYMYGEYTSELNKKLRRLYNDVRRTEDEIIFQKQLIKNGSICFYDSNTTEYYPINEDTIEEYDDSDIVYIDDIRYKYENMIEANNVTLNYLLMNYMIVKEYLSISNSMTNIERFNKLMYLFANIETKQLDTDEFYFLSSKSGYYIININNLITYINTIIEDLRKLNMFNNNLNFAYLANFIYSNENNINIKIYKGVNEESAKMHLRKIQNTLYENIFTTITLNSLQAIVNPDDGQYVKNDIDILLNDLYEHHIELYTNLISLYGIKLYEYADSNTSVSMTTEDVNEYDIGKYENTSIIDNSLPIRIFEYDGKKYACVLMSQMFTNTDLSYNTGTQDIFTSINGKDVYIELNSMDTLNSMMPYFKQNMFFNLENILEENDILNICIYPRRYDIRLKYTYDIETTITKNYEDSLLKNVNDIKNGDTNIYKLVDLNSYKIMGLFRYLNYITPIFVDVHKFVPLYERKFKYIDSLKFGSDNIYKENVFINQYSGVKCFNNPNYSKIDDNKYVIENNIEYKHFNNNSYYNLEPNFEIKVDKELTYEELLEYEKSDKIYEYFKNYVKKYSKFIRDDKNQILFLFNKYKVSCNSAPILLNFLRTHKLYSLKYIFNLL